MKMTRKLFTICTILMIAGFSDLAVSAEANAAETVTCGNVSVQDPTDGDKMKLAVTACFHSYGDYFTLTDENSDTFRADVQWRTDYGRIGECQNAKGAGTTVKCDWDMREGHNINFTVYALKDGVSVMAGVPKNATI